MRIGDLIDLESVKNNIGSWPIPTMVAIGWVLETAMKKNPANATLWNQVHSSRIIVVARENGKALAIWHTEDDEYKVLEFKES